MKTPADFTVFDLVKGDTHIVDLETEMIARSCEITALQDKIRQNNWWNSRKQEANRTRRRLDQRRAEQLQFGVLIRQLAQINKIDCDDTDELFRDYHWTLVIKRKPND